MDCTVGRSISPPPVLCGTVGCIRVAVAEGSGDDVVVGGGLPPPTPSSSRPPAAALDDEAVVVVVVVVAVFGGITGNTAALDSSVQEVLVGVVSSPLSQTHVFTEIFSSSLLRLEPVTDIDHRTSRFFLRLRNCTVSPFI